MKIKQISLFVENKPGSMNGICRALSDANVNIATLSLADTEDYGVLRLLVDDIDKSISVLKEKNYAFKITDVVALEVSHQSGSLAAILDIFSKKGIGIDYMYAYAAGVNDKAALIFRFSDSDNAIAKLKDEKNIRFLSAEELIHGSFSK